MDHRPVASARTRRFGVPAAIVYAGCALPLVASAIGTSWPLELASHFVPLAALVAAVTAALCSLRRRWLEAGAGLALGALYAAACVPLYAAPATAPAGVPLKVLTANLLYTRVDAGPVRAFIDRMEPDVLVLIELTPRWRAALEPTLQRFAHSTEILRDDAFGSGIYSRASSLEPLDVAFDGPPMIGARLRDAQRDVTLIAVHTMPPISAEAAALRDRQLAHVAGLAKRTLRNLVIAGDLNTTSWSPVFRRLLVASGLVDTRRGFGIQGSWYSSWPTPIRIPIDHVLTSPDVVTTRRELGPNTGSDHRPVFVELSLR